MKYQLHPRGITVAAFVDGVWFIPHRPDRRTREERLQALEHAFDREANPTRAEQVLRVYLNLIDEV